MLEEYKQTSLYNDIEALVLTNGLDYIDAVLFFCETNGLDVEAVGDLISKNDLLKSKIELEAEELHFIKKTARLSI